MRGSGVQVQGYADLQEPSVLEVRTSVVDDNAETGVYVTGSDATLDATVIRATKSASNGGYGWGLSVAIGQSSGRRSSAIVRSSVLSGNHESAVFVGGSDAAFEATVLHDTKAQAFDDNGGSGLRVQPDPATGERSVVTLDACSLEGNREYGVLAAGSDVTLDGTIVRATTAARDNQLGMGFALVPHGGARGVRGSAKLHHSVFERNHTIGALIQGSDATLEGTIVRNTLDGETADSGSFMFHDDGGNACGCEGQSVPCQALSSNLTPPGPIGPVEPHP